MHGIDSSQVGAFTADVELRLYCLDNDDGVVDHRSDHQHEGKERQHVQREADGIDDSQGGYQRHDDGDGWNDRGPPALQEQEHHEDYQQQRFEQGFEHAGNRGVEEVLLRLDILDDDAWGQ